MTRMTKAMRSTIADRIVDKVKAAREADLLHREHALAARLLRYRYGDDVFERCRALPEGWLTLQKSVMFSHRVYQNFPGVERKGRFYSVERKSTVRLAEYAPLPCSNQQGWEREDLGLLYDDAYAFAADWAALHRELDQLRGQILGTLAAFSTVERLAEGWPEGYAALPAEMTASTGAGLPALRIADLNARIASAMAGNEQEQAEDGEERRTA